ncbi:hypothetical protein [Catenovulum maritimum]|uniref:hypothetical protein n=1 Tax=Catenovulum maritimum TaxID=1513271 RepID=UPI00065FCB98|nr:hypothetical protein [Catenovulum maritimum]
MKKICLTIALLIGLVTNSYAEQRQDFDLEHDTLLAQFDIKGDLDDVHAIAALGSLLAHPDYKSLLPRTYAVQGTAERTSGKQYRVPELMIQAFGAKNSAWFDALADHDKAVKQMYQVVLSALKQNNNQAKVWVMEAGQNGFTHDWLKLLLEQDNGVTAKDSKERIIVVQHSWFNEQESNKQKLSYVQQNTTYVAIDDGNEHYGQGHSAKTIRGAHTARLQGRQTETDFNPGDSKWLDAARSENNTKTHAKKLWTMADDYIKNLPHIHGKLHQQGGTDYSDMVEVLWILGLNDSIQLNSQFWRMFVTSIEVK